MAPERIAFVLIDGLGDVNEAGLGGRTPLQAAHTPFLDAIAAAGLNGLMDPVAPGLACGSDTAHLSLLGHDPRACYRGRGAFESLGAGLLMDPGDIAFKANFATLDPASGIVLRRRADRRFEAEGPVLCAALDGLPIPGFPELGLRVRYATEHRAGVVIAGPGLTDAITGTDPLRDGLPLLDPAPVEEERGGYGEQGNGAADGSGVEAGGGQGTDAEGNMGGPPGDEPAGPRKERPPPSARSAACYSAAATRAASDAMRAALARHPINAERVSRGLPPANVVLLRGCGARLALPAFPARHGLRGGVAAPTRIIRGLALTLGMAALDVPGGTGDYHTALHAKAQAVAAALSAHRLDLGFLHVKAVDDAGHDGSAAHKAALLGAVDAMVGQLLARLARARLDSGEEGGVGEYTIVVTGDHSTPVATMDHSCEPVPVAIAHLRHVEMGKPSSAQTFGDSVSSFDESAAGAGGLGRFPGSQLMPLIKHFAGHVVAGCVGNKAAVFPLQLLGFEVDAVNTVQFSNHTGYPLWKGKVLSGEELWDLIDAMETNGLLSQYTHLLTGFIGSLSLLHTIHRVLLKLREYNPALVYVCDPVQGDNGQLYVSPDLPPAFRSELTPIATIMTPNQLEAELLTERSIGSVQEALDACAQLHRLGPHTVVITSLDLEPDHVTVLASTTQPQAEGALSTFRILVPRVQAYVTGTGELGGDEYRVK
ncbi:2,3-bisphosphoglycerate-independent phosphoglycerate mutase 1 [Auxenochlorella protothecoides]|uniref:pyridoxal kinase n=1 Tax=Auxenochlorella protothecoides TaxID=3075 RepID=A0A087SLU4_AUXPR|nr:2,3-bisphosphoglycerate-independent phosphoglycerate mutase 1 [Auxenochlorella protothecoides]KFM26698.1 2,3-bisphosphoglycerate-independent phosphoglycerate mutase 1 [Auxenochlorella protothecoides]